MTSSPDLSLSQANIFSFQFTSGLSRVCNFRCTARSCTCFLYLKSALKHHANPKYEDAVKICLRGASANIEFVVVSRP